MNGTAQSVTGQACRHGSDTLRRIADVDASLVYLYCWGCSRVLGVYDPQKRGSLQLSQLAS